MTKIFIPKNIIKTFEDVMDYHNDASVSHYRELLASLFGFNPDYIYPVPDLTTPQAFENCNRVGSCLEYLNLVLSNIHHAIHDRSEETPPEPSSTFWRFFGGNI